MLFRSFPPRDGMSLGVALDLNSIQAKLGDLEERGADNMARIERQLRLLNTSIQKLHSREPVQPTSRAFAMNSPVYRRMSQRSWTHWSAQQRACTHRNARCRAPRRQSTRCRVRTRKTTRRRCWRHWSARLLAQGRWGTHARAAAATRAPAATRATAASAYPRLRSTMMTTCDSARLRTPRMRATCRSTRANCFSGSAARRESQCRRDWRGVTGAACACRQNTREMSLGKNKAAERTLTFAVHEHVDAQHLHTLRPSGGRAPGGLQKQAAESVHACEARLATADPAHYAPGERACPAKVLR